MPPPPAPSGLRPDLAHLPGAPESRLAGEVLARLPASTPAPPWRTRVEAVFWWHRASPAALAVLPEPLRRTARLPLVVGAFVRYLDTPVGPYEEVIGAVAHCPLQVHVPFIAVDSVPSVHGGRAHWALPKALATFTRIGPGVTAYGGGWRLSAEPVAGGPRLPVAGRLRDTQVDAGGALRTSASRAWGRARLARVLVTVGTDLAGEPGSIAGWLRSGRHPGAVLRARLVVGPPAAAAAA